MHQALFCGIIFAILMKYGNKQLQCENKGRSTLVNTLIPNMAISNVMYMHCTVRKYSSDQLLSWSSAPRKVSRLSNEVLARLKEYDILMYRGKRAGCPRARIRDTSQGVNVHNHVQIKIDQIVNLNTQRKNKLTLSTVNTRSLCGKSAELLQHIHEEQIDICVITETWLQPEGDDRARGELRQDGYYLDDVPRTQRKGGGLSLLCRDNLK